MMWYLRKYWVYNGAYEVVTWKLYATLGEAESQAICELLSKPSTSKTTSLAKKKEVLSKKLLAIIDSLETEEELETIERFLNPVEPTLAAMRKSTETQHFVPTNNFAHNKKIDPQRRFYSTKKKTKRSKKAET
ncbi:hypothetical protein NQ317_019171 [Molorchus minor]|uniref:Uncharacterized protein n=1 Tax=Molorchus minor TaxID=1323400 RepID=A0ABQ9JTJ5_9CUCU|nr:hypothetical protein NQ317_019171 [Molorchus minor]